MERQPKATVSFDTRDKNGLRKMDGENVGEFFFSTTWDDNVARINWIPREGGEYKC